MTIDSRDDVAPSAPAAARGVRLGDPARLARASAAALVVGAILTLIDRTGVVPELFAGRAPALAASMRIALTFFVPFLVALASFALADRKRAALAPVDPQRPRAEGSAPIARGERDVVLVIADISGYTDFMVATRTELAHGQHIIGVLLEAILEEVEIPLEISKFEGDAVFLYLARQDDGAWPTALVEAKLPRLFTSFHARLRSVAEGVDCRCGACANLGNLRLKLVVHAGTALFYEIAGRTELAGVDVILVHRLLENSVETREYALLTEEAGRLLSPDLPPLGRSTEAYPAIGPVGVIAYAPPSTAPGASA